MTMAALKARILFFSVFTCSVCYTCSRWSFNIEKDKSVTQTSVVWLRHFLSDRSSSADPPFKEISGSRGDDSVGTVLATLNSDPQHPHKSWAWWHVPEFQRCRGRDRKIHDACWLATVVFIPPNITLICPGSFLVSYSETGV